MAAIKCEMDDCIHNEYGWCGCADILISKASGGACVDYATVEPFEAGGGMTDKEKVEKALERINEEGLENKRIAPNDMLEAIVSVGIKEIAYEMSQIINLVYDLREILEDEEG